MVFTLMDECKHKDLQTEILTGFIVHHFPPLANSSEEVFFDVAEEFLTHSSEFTLYAMQHS